EDSGQANVVIWNTIKKENGGYAATKELLEKVNLIDKFNGQSRFNGFSAEFKIPGIFKSIEEIDKAVVTFVKEVLTKLNAVQDGTSR
ncbi:MAG TPA: hypothetical protein PK977_01455, partial [Chitinophagaceae bacterium]|nr:hypothetical protein [Chitinophagaceae bacterium]